MSNVNLYSPESSFLLHLPDYPTPIDFDSLDYKVMHEDDILFDSLDLDLSLFNHSLVEKPRSGRKTWSDVIGHEHMREPMNLRATPEPTESAPSKVNEVCRYWLNGNCIYGDKCWYAHHLTKQQEVTKQPFFDEISTTCCICQEDILKNHKRFGLMQSKCRKEVSLVDCNHLFCLECIRNWRYSNLGDPNVRRCPLCRATSFYVIPSNEPIFDPEVKQITCRNPLQVFQWRKRSLPLWRVLFLFAQTCKWRNVCFQNGDAT